MLSQAFAFPLPHGQGIPTQPGECGDVQIIHQHLNQNQRQLAHALDSRSTSVSIFLSKQDQSWADEVAPFSRPPPSNQPGGAQTKKRSRYSRPTPDAPLLARRRHAHPACPTDSTPPNLADMSQVHFLEDGGRHSGGCLQSTPYKVAVLTLPATTPPLRPAPLPIQCRVSRILTMLSLDTRMCTRASSSKSAAWRRMQSRGRCW